MENDSRFWKSFRTKNNLNRANTASQLSGTDPHTSDAHTYGLGDLGLIYIINDKTDSRFVKDKARMTNHTGVYYLNPTTGKPSPHTFVRYFSDGSAHLRETSLTNRFPSISKHMDGSRPNHNHETGNRDGILARVAETYLIKAEALIRQENYPEAINVINVVRARAEFKSGEDRARYIDGGAAYLNNTAGQATYGDGILVNAYSDLNSYYESLDIPVTTDPTILTNYTVANLPAVDEAIISTLGLSFKLRQDDVFFTQRADTRAGWRILPLGRSGTYKNIAATC
jgi:starch-binding outer membrane protein, SusD/RagB family